jgi:hypothetical protein
MVVDRIRQGTNGMLEEDKDNGSIWDSGNE